MLAAVIEGTVKESVRTRPEKLSFLRNRPLITLLERLAGLDVRPGTEAFATITAGVPARIAAENGCTPGVSTPT